MAPRTPPFPNVLDLKINFSGATPTHGPLRNLPHPLTTLFTLPNSFLGVTPHSWAAYTQKHPYCDGCDHSVITAFSLRLDLKITFFGATPTPGPLCSLPHPLTNFFTFHNHPTGGVTPPSWAAYIEKTPHFWGVITL